MSQKNPLDRVIQMVPEGNDRLIIETTTEKLAQRLGKAVYRAYKGSLDFRWSHMNKFVPGLLVQITSIEINIEPRRPFFTR